MPEYGFEIRRANGSLALSTRETLLRLVHIERVDGDFAGTFSVPEFDAVESNGVFTGPGFFYVQKVVAPSTVNSGSLSTQTLLLPTLNWNNTSKVMSVTPANLPSGWPVGTFRSPYEVVFMHFR